jgi:GNAT superfamily N-acetyltransferase
LSLSPRLVVDPATVDDRLLATALAAPDPALAISIALGQPGLKLSRATFRWSGQPATLPEVGEWVPHEDPRIPAWLQAFNGDVLVAWDDEGRVAAGVGRKRHNRYGHELAVGTDPAHQGRRLARKLIAQAARRVLADGAVPLYFHLPDNVASARVADAAGFPDRGWHVVGLY